MRGHACMSKCKEHHTHMASLSASLMALCHPGMVVPGAKTTVIGAFRMILAKTAARVLPFPGGCRHTTGRNVQVVDLQPALALRC